MKSETIHYNCDNCDRTLKTGDNELNIMTSKSESSYWKRLHLRILVKSGMNNDCTEEDADLCKKCAIDLLEDALRRVKSGERTTAGTASIDAEKWH